MPGLRDQGSSGHRRSRRADATATAAYRFGCGCWAEDEYREIARLNGLGDVQTVGVAAHTDVLPKPSSSTLAPLVRATLSRARMSFGKQDPP